ncbi:unnamed protein product [Somion occarium]|uniref:Uncharacterized protein n=1 Tax=Somion occarium TaxID=3059160 RepID=A0ABP1DFD1_9APHY
MFPKGNRFPPAKPSQVPGPNAYDVHEYDTYKRGAFLEKTDRFKAKGSDVPGPDAYNTETKMTAAKLFSNTKTSSDRYAVLQRKVEELERLYAEGKKSHALEVDRLKSELSRVQRTNAEHSDRLDKFKKQNESLESRLQETKKAHDSGQFEIKDLRAKLRISEHERNQLASKQGDLGETKKALQALDSKRRDELRERDRKVAELEKAVAAEKKKRELLETKLFGINAKTDSELQAAKDATKLLEVELKETKAEAQKAKSTLTALQDQAADTEDELLTQLEQHRLVLSRVAEEYGRLASSTVSKIKYDQLVSESAVKQLRIVRLERKLANSEGQVTELAHLIRTTKDDNVFLSQQLREAQYEIGVYSSLLKDARDVPPNAPFDASLYEELASCRSELQKDDLETQQAIANVLVSWSHLDRLRVEELLLHSSSLLKHVDDRDAQLKAQSKQLSVSAARQGELQHTISSLHTEQERLQTQLSETVSALAVAQSGSLRLKQRLEETEASAKAEREKLQRMAAQEKQIAQKLAISVQEAKAAEAALVADIEQLTADLAEAERYQEAYTSLVEEVDALIQRNALAEDEAQRVSRFNAEILGHHNPAQRIMYVDRIRRELFETKQDLLMTTRDRDAVINENDALRHELFLYKSVAVHPDDKPKTTITRVTRIPLGMQNMNVKSTSTSRSASGTGKLASMPEAEYKEGDMTVDEIL